jgi:hypothetical protein
MSQASNDKVFEEINPFPEKVAGSMSIDGEETIILEDIDILENHEEMLVSDADASRESLSIEDEHVTLNTKQENVKKTNNVFDVESLAQEIDSMGIYSENLTLDSSKEDFWEVLEDEDLKMIDDVVKSSGDVFLDSLEPVQYIGSLDTGEDKVQLVHDDILYKNKKLWEEEEDFVITEIQGFGDIQPYEFMDYVEKGKIAEGPLSGIPPFSAEEEKAASVLIDDAFSVDVPEPIIIDELEPAVPDVSVEPVKTKKPAAVIKAAPKPEPVKQPVVQKKAAPRQKGKYDDIEIPFIMLDENDTLPGLEETAEASAEIEHTIVENLIPARKDVKKEIKVPDNFKLNPIDLGEAERIAREDMVILSEEDLIEELETYDMTPQKNEPVQPSSISINRTFDYLTPRDSAIDADHRVSIEDDIESGNAVVIEENAGDIHVKLKTTTKLEKEKDKDEEEIMDITDRVIILDDESSLDKFIAAMPEKKREDMRKLMHYLDGLFDKLPEEVVRRFADSEYFDLYAKIMNDLEA